MEQKIRKIIASLEAQFTGDEEHDLGVVSKYLGSLERSVETAQIAKAIPSIAAMTSQTRGDVSYAIVEVSTAVDTTKITGIDGLIGVRAV